MCLLALLSTHIQRMRRTYQVRCALSEAATVLSTLFLVAGELLFGAILARLVQAVEAQHPENGARPLVAASGLVLPAAHRVPDSLDERRRAA
jgi:hypothetical protein